MIEITIKDSVEHTLFQLKDGDTGVEYQSPSGVTKLSPWGQWAIMFVYAPKQATAITEKLVRSDECMFNGKRYLIGEGPDTYFLFDPDLPQSSNLKLDFDGYKEYLDFEEDLKRKLKV